MIKHALRLLLPLLLAVDGVKAAAAQPSLADLVGNWESRIDVGKFKIRVIVRISEAPGGKFSAKLDVPDQGAKDIPVSAMLCNFPAVRWEINQIGTAFNGSVQAGAREISGVFEEGPGGRPMPAVFKRLDKLPEEPKRAYTFGPGETRDIRGYWKGEINLPPFMSSRVGLKIGRAPEGDFGVLLDLLDRGAKDIPATKVSFTEGLAKFEWELFQMTFEGKLDSEANRLSGTCKQRGKPSPLSFERVDAPVTAVPANLSFTPDPGAPGDVRGYWQGALEVGGNSLRLLVKLGKTPDGTFSGTLSSLDQGGGEIPMTSAGVTNSAVRLEWKGIQGVFKGSLNQQGTALDGTWEQMGPPLKLKLERVPAPAELKPH